MPEQGKDFQHEADFLASFLEHDNTPKDMCDYIGGLVFDVAGSVSLRTPPVLTAP